MFKRYRFWIVLLVIIAGASGALLAQTKRANQALPQISLDSPASLPSDI